MDGETMVFLIVLVACSAGVLRAWADAWAKRGTGGNPKQQLKIQEHDATIAELRQRVEHLEIIITDPGMLAAMEVQKSLKSPSHSPLRPSSFETGQKG